MTITIKYLKCHYLINLEYEKTTFLSEKPDEGEIDTADRKYICHRLSSASLLYGEERDFTLSQKR